MKKIKMIRNILVMTVLTLSGCATFESRLTSHVGCPENEIKIIDKSNNFFGPQKYTVSCRGRIFHCTETYKENDSSDLKCAAETK